MIGIPVKNSNDNPEIDERFGRGQYFCIIDANGKYTIVENSAKEQASGAGGQAVKILADNNVDTVIAPHIGPKAMDAINALGIKAYNKGDAKTVKEALDLFESNKLEEVTKAAPGLKRV